MHLIGGIVALDPGPTAAPRIVKVMVDSIGHRDPDDEVFYAAGPAALHHHRLPIIELSRGYKPIAKEDGAVRIFFDRKIYRYCEWLGYVRPVPTNPCRRGRGYFAARTGADMLQRTQAAEDLSAEGFSLLTLELWRREFIDTDHRATLISIDTAERPNGAGA